MNKKGFTLIELLVVISIISLITSIVLAGLNEARSKARDTKRLEDLRQINIAIQLYIQDNGKAPMHPDTSGSYSTFNSASETQWETLEQELAPYISKLPIDPLNGQQISFYPDDWLSTFSPEYVPQKYSYRYRNMGSYGMCSSYPENCIAEAYKLEASSFERREQSRNTPLSAFWGGAYPKIEVQQ